ncbi:MAG: AAA family ATPase [Bacteroidia bacterium]
MSFKIIAIRPLSNCTTTLKKNLDFNVFYALYNDYRFTPSTDENQIEINYSASIPFDLYNTENTIVNVSAIVGKNGSGKSSIIELLYAALYNLSINYKFIVDPPKEKKKPFILDDYNLQELKENLELYNRKKPNISQIESLSSDIALLENLKENIESDWKINDQKVEFNRHLPLGLNTIEFGNLKNVNWHEDSLSEINSQLDKYKKYKLDLEKHFKKTDEDIDDKVEYIDNLNVQIIFETEQELYVITVKGKDIVVRPIKKLSTIGKVSTYALDSNENKDVFNTLKNKHLFFYSIVNNYSLYGLNSLEIGDWINRIFHKNDGYQTPIVINPMRTEGRIDVNRENYLSKSRLLSNILSKVETEDIKESLRCLVNDKVAGTLILNLNIDKFRNRNGKITLQYLSLKDQILHKILNAFKNSPDEPDYSPQDIKERYSNPSIVEQYAIEYVFSKIEKIAANYKVRGRKYGKNFNLTQHVVLDSILEEFQTDFSHITFKLRQVINFLKYDYKSLDKSKTSLKIPINDLSKEINLKIAKLLDSDKDHAKKKYLEEKEVKGKSSGKFKYIQSPKFDLINFLPPSFFYIDIGFEQDKGKFSSMSSGEKQHVYSMSSIVYHLLNLKSIEPIGQVKYNYYNIVLDEIELYFHPDFQKTFVSDLLDNIRRTNKSFSGINIIFVTHSPFILSDIPHTNILFLEDGSPKPRKIRYRTFGANIHDLLADSFFMPNGYIGKFAQAEIEKTIEWLSIQYDILIEKLDEQDYTSFADTVAPEEKLRHKQIIELIDEPVLKNKLLDMYKRIFTYGKEKEKEIADVIREAERLGLQIVKPE